MKIIFTGPIEKFDAAMILLSAELRDWEQRYTKVGWGWSHGKYIRELGVSEFFVRRIADGLSVTARATPADHGVGDSCASEASQPAMSVHDEPLSPSPKPPVEGA